jgi:integrase
MRREEIANIRLGDVDLDRHEIFVRLPNKTNTERTTRFGEKAKAMISAWLRDRNPNCGHDHLFHNSQNNPCNGIQMHLEFVKVLCKSWIGQKLHEEGLESWSIHRLRHTMATRLAAGGADASTIMGAGGWTTYTAMVGYTAVDPEESRRGYEEAMRRFAESSERTPQTVTLSLEQYLERTHTAP